MQPKNRPYGLLPTRWAFRWIVYAVGAALLFAGASALFFDASTTAAGVRGAAFGVFMATVSIIRERPWPRSRRGRRTERSRRR